MFKKFCTVLGLIILSGCQTSTVGMKLESSSRPDTTLVGSLERQTSKFTTNTFTMVLTDGDLECSGVSEIIRSINGNGFTLEYPNVVCSDGRTGNAKLILSGNFLRHSGVGVGRLKDGTKLKLIVGDLKGAIDW